MNEKLLIQVTISIIFRFFHLLFLLESDIFALFSNFLNLNRKSEKNEEEVEIFNIFARFKFDPTDGTRESDFLVFHEKFSLFEEICEEGWHIYNITENYVYFVKISPIDDAGFENTISIEKTTKLSNFLFQNAEKLARCQISDFNRFSKVIPAGFRSKVLMLHTAPSSGGSTVGKLIQSVDNSKLSLLVIGEPPFLTSLSLIYNRISIESVRDLCKSTLRFTMLHQKEHQTILVKCRSSCTKLVPLIHAELPSIQHFFIFRKNFSSNFSRNFNEVISRLVIYTSKDLPIFSSICRFKYLSTFLSNWREFEEVTVRRVDPRNDVEFATCQVFGAILHFFKFKDYFVQEVPTVEELISDTVNAIRPILDLCEISDLAIPECLDWKRSAEKNVKEVWDTVELSIDDVARVDEIVAALQNFVF